jgi:O-antigen ligase
MSQRALSIGQSDRTTLVLLVAATPVAGAIGVLAAVSPSLAAAAVVALVAVPAAVLKPKLIAHLLIATVFLEATTIGGVTVARLAAPFALIAVISQLAHAQVWLRRATPTLPLVAAYAGLAIASLAWTVSFEGTLDALGSLSISIIYLGAFAILITSERDLQRLLWTLAGSSTILALLWITRFASGVDRRFNSAGDPNFVAAFQVVALPLVLVTASYARTPARRALLWIATALIAGSVISTLSRAGLVTILIAVILIAALPSRSLFRRPGHKVVLLIAAAIGLALLLAITWADISHRFQVGFAQENVAGGRGDLWMAALHGFSTHPLTGLGYGGFRTGSFQLLAQTPGVDLASHLRFAARTGEYVHNAYLGSLAELGLMGLALFVAIFLSSARSLRKTAAEARAGGDAFLRSLANALLLGLFAFALSSAVLSTETSRILWVIVGLSLSLPHLAHLRIRERNEADRMPTGRQDPSLPQPRIL